MVAALNAGGDQWDNPRYRAILLVWQVILAAWAWEWARLRHDAWLWRWLAVAPTRSRRGPPKVLAAGLRAGVPMILTFAIVFLLAAASTRGLLRQHDEVVAEHPQADRRLESLKTVIEAPREPKRSL